MPSPNNRLEIPSTQPYRLGFVAGALGVAQCRTLAALWRRHGSWDEVRVEALGQNAMLQSRHASLVRVEREYRQRLQTLTDAQLALLTDATGDTARLIALLAAFKHYAFLFDFCCLVLRQKMQTHDLVLRPSDYEAFVSSADALHPELAQLSPSTRGKIRQVTMRLLAEGGLLSGTRKPMIVRPNLTPDFVRCVIEDEPAYLAGFLVQDGEMRAMTGRAAHQPSLA